MEVVPIRCTALKKDGTQCTHNATVTDVRNYCGTHHNSKMRSDASYRTAYNAFIEQGRRQREAAIMEREAQRQREFVAQRTARQTRNAALLEDAATFSTMRILKYASRLITLWNDEHIPGYSCPKAYAFLTFLSPRHEGFVPLIRAVVSILNLTTHPDFAHYRDVPEAERATALVGLDTALQAYGDINYKSLIPATDRTTRELIQRRERRDEEQRQIAEALAAAARLAAEAAARRAAFEQADREQPVVFQRDPEGGIDLRAFANDPQSVHRSSVQNTTQRMVQQLLSRPVPTDQETIFEINMDLSNPAIVGWRDEHVKLATINMFTDEYFTLEAFSVKYSDVVDRVWAFIRSHAERTELTIRLAQEICEGVGMCANGKMARLVNVLQGYDETLEVEPPREMFQSAIAALMNRPLAEREARARELFVEYRIPTEEHDVWLEPLMETEI
jgi:hypothetical protein